MKKYLLLLTVFNLISCATSSDPSLAAGVKRKGGGVYSVSELGLGFSLTDPTTQAVKQCQLDGNKRLVIIASTSESGFSGNQYPMLVFRCM